MKKINRIPQIERAGLTFLDAWNCLPDSFGYLKNFAVGILSIVVLIYLCQHVFLTVNII